MFASDIEDLARAVLAAARASGIKVATAESCTGGLVAASLTGIAGSSDVFDRGFVTYSNAAKVAALGVPDSVIQLHGAVSEQTARAMAEGALDASLAQASVAVTGIAGPGGGSLDKPVGLVHFAAARTGRPTVHREMRYGDLGRGKVREESLKTALWLLMEAVGQAAVAP